MSLPKPEQNQLTAYYEREMLKRGNQEMEPGYSGIGFWWYGYPVYANSMQRYGGLSTPSGVAEKKVVDRSQGDRSKNTGMMDKSQGAPPTAGASPGGM